MKKNIFIARSRFHCAAQELFDWHERPGAFERLSPPWVDVQCVERSGGIKDGSRVVLLLEKGPVRMPWVLGHKEYDAGKHFVDYQIAGPFDLWQQSHDFEEDGPAHCYLTDRVEFQLPLGFAGKFAGAGFIRGELARLFRYRHALLTRDMKLLKRYGQGKTLKVLISGATGLVGANLKAFLETQGHQVISLLRRQTSSAAGENVIFWDPERGTCESQLPDDLDAVVHLAGRNVAAARWTLEEKHLIHESRVKGTQYLVQLMTVMKNPPRVFICASATGFYGDRGSEPLTEDSAGGNGFLAEVCHDWEAAALKAQPATRVVLARIGAVLSPRGGALAKLLPVFSAGGGGRIGSGQQYFSWVSLDDVLGALYHAMVNPQVSGALNVVAPNCVTNNDFTRALSRALLRPALFPVPPGVLRLAMGEMADALLMGSTRVLPQKLKQTEYEFLDPDLYEALRFMLGRSAGHQ